MKRRSFLQMIGAVVAAPFAPKVKAAPAKEIRYQQVTKTNDITEPVWPTWSPTEPVMEIIYLPPKSAGSIYAQLKEKKGWKPVSEYGRESERMIGEFGSFGNIRLIQKST